MPTRLWLTGCIWGLRLLPFMRMSLLISTPSSRAHTLTTQAGAGRGDAGGDRSRKTEVVLQVWEWWLLTIDVPLRHYGSPHTTSCTMANLMAICSPAVSTVA